MVISAEMPLKRFYASGMLLLCGALLVFQLFVPPTLGVADNNDFPKLMGQFCLGQEHHPLFDYVSFRFHTNPKYCWDSHLLSSAALPVQAAVWLGRLVLPAGDFDLRILGAIYAALFLLFFHFLQVSTRELSPATRVLLPALVLLFFDTATYVPTFSTFYSDTASFIILLFCAVFICRLVLRNAVSTAEYLVAAVCVILLVTSKAQHAVLGLLMAPAFLPAFGRARFPAVGVRIVAVSAIAVASVAMFVSVPRWYCRTNYFNALFYQSLPRSSTPAADLADLGIKAGMIRYVGQHAFLPDSPMQDSRQADDFGQTVSAMKLVRYYGSHLAVMMQVLDHALDEGGLQRVRMEIGNREYRLGNYEIGAGHEPASQSQFMDFWSIFKALLFGNRGWLYGLYVPGLSIAAWTLARKTRPDRRARAYLLAGIMTSMIVTAVAVVMFDGIDTGRHLFLLNALLDLSFCTLAGFAVGRRQGDHSDGDLSGKTAIDEQRAYSSRLAAGRITSVVG